MEKTKVISVRLPESLVDRIDHLAIDQRYWTRNAVISKILECTLDCADPGSLNAIIRNGSRDKATHLLQYVLRGKV